MEDPHNLQNEFLTKQLLRRVKQVVLLGSCLLCLLLGSYIEQYCGHFFDFERIFVRLKFVSDYLSTSYKFQYLFV